MNIGIILAAGEGTRMKSRHPKVLHKISGKPLLSYVLDEAEKAGIRRNVVIVGHGKEAVMESITGENIIYEEQPVHQGAPYGTGYAVMQGMGHVGDEDNVVVLCGDTPLITASTLTELMKYHNSQNNKATVLTTCLEDPTGYGRIVRKSEGSLQAIVEHKDATEDQRKIGEINSGIYCFSGKELKLGLDGINNDNSQNEYYLTDVIGVLVEGGYKVGAFMIEDASQIHGINSRVQLAQADDIIRERINLGHMENGVTLINPKDTYIESTVRIGRDTIVYPGAVLEGDTVIGEDCTIRGATRIVDSIIGDEVSIESTLIENSKVGDGCKIGPYAHLRPDSELGRNVKIGNFVEIKKAILGDDSKASHLSYVGDAQVGSGVNIGCGVVFVNYDGERKFKSIIGDNAFIGSNSNLVAPVKVESWGYVAAGSTITDNVGEGELSIARARQVNKAGWVEKKGLKKRK
ncbi:bifunctional UDP-N-acetylglucosamine diphosphorylase/glucosamine-1-phosphate N-acetyltransferase GlmU [Gudongella sp. SC589]|uniref:bifunctional UDP-N-acetylglucosamine diphosphorylase/glucosamine-1-phosphate N-acetyltransferase GlmU n=1 Tax=Gudongella sp. SC589 TaxID=3385990 RepID=UPI00390499C9